MTEKSNKYRNPQNDYVETISPFCWLWTLLFGAIYFAVKGVWTHFVVGIILAVITVGISWLIYPYFAKSILQKHYLKQGYVAVSADGGHSE